MSSNFTGLFRGNLRRQSAAFSVLLLISCLLNFSCFAQTSGSKPNIRRLKIGILISTEDESRNKFSEKINEYFEQYQQVAVADDSLVKLAAKGFGYKDSLNLSVDEAKTLGIALGCDFYLLGKTETLRRSSFKKAVYFESYAFVFLVSARTGKLILSEILSFEGDSPEKSEGLLLNSTSELTAKLANKLLQMHELEKSPKLAPEIEILPDEPHENFRTPLPYKRIKPAYTKQAEFYTIEATVDVLVDIDEKGFVTRTEITRWAGFGLDESVETTVKKMNFRSALRDGKAIPLRFLLRYNFRKPESDI